MANILTLDESKTDSSLGAGVGGWDLKKLPCATVDVAARQRGCEEGAKLSRKVIFGSFDSPGATKAEGKFPLRGTGATREKVRHLLDLH